MTKTNRDPSEQKIEIGRVVVSNVTFLSDFLLPLVVNGIQDPSEFGEDLGGKGGGGRIFHRLRRNFSGAVLDPVKRRFYVQ